LAFFEANYFEDITALSSQVIKFIMAFFKSCYCWNL